MSFINQGAYSSQASLASATSANGTARHGTAKQTNSIMPGTVVLECDATIVTGSVVATFWAQGSNDNSTFYDIHGPENVAFVTITATGSAALCIPPGLAGYKWFRAASKLSGAPTAGGDLTQVTTRFLRYGELDQ